MPAELNALYDDYIGEKEGRMTEEFTPLARRNQSLGLKAKAFFFCKKACL